MSPDMQSTVSGDHLVLMRSMPGDNRMHSVDARDVALAFANGVDREATIAGKSRARRRQRVATCRLHRDLEDGLMTAVGLGRARARRRACPATPTTIAAGVSPGGSTPPKSQALLDFQEHDWADDPGLGRRIAGPHPHRLLRVLGPVLRPALRAVLPLQRRVEGRGRYADPWSLIARKYGAGALATPENA